MNVSKKITLLVCTKIRNIGFEKRSKGKAQSLKPAQETRLAILPSPFAMHRRRRKPSPSLHHHSSSFYHFSHRPYVVHTPFVRCSYVIHTPLSVCCTTISTTGTSLLVLPFTSDRLLFLIVVTSKMVSVPHKSGLGPIVHFLD